MLRICCVCLGNICRSPVAEVLLRQKFIEAGYAEGVDFFIDSAGTGDWHVGHPPDRRSQEVCRRYDLDISGQRARKFTAQDGADYDYIFGMDRNNIDNICAIIDPEHYGKVQLFDTHEVNDPYYGILDGFEIMYQQLERAAENWVKTISKLAS